MKEVRDCLDALISALENCDDFKMYKEARARMHEYPEKEKRVRELRKKNYLLQNSKEKVDLFVELERLEQEYADVYKDPLLQSFLSAEVAVCKIVQQVNLEMINCLDFEDVLVDD